jgi:queuine tRNA-ribosyltransferase
MRPGFGFEIRARDGAARLGRLSTPHGALDTPAFLPVGSYGAVRGVDPAALAELGAQILLANAYHLHERPGEAVVAGLGGLHGFSGWRGPWLTDSGGFQLTSLAERVQVGEEGVAFASPLDGRRRWLSPERAVEIQEALGPDIAMVLDECRRLEDGTDPDGLARRAAAERTLRWAERARRAHRRGDQALFAIVQGGACPRLRAEGARHLAALGFDGFAHGGLGLGESAAARAECLAAVHEALPAGAPRYLMGLGRPVDVLRAVARGVDLFDCVLPTRHARHAVLFTGSGLLRLRHARYRADPLPADPECDCPACRSHSRAYLAHLLRVNDALGARLATLHNLRFYLRLFERIRAAIVTGALAELAREIEAGQ